MSDSKKVTTGKPKVGGGVSRAPLGTTLPVNATAELDAAFKNLGYISDAGVVNSNSISSTAIKAWGGDTVYDAQTDKTDTFKFTLLEVLDPEVIKVPYGDDNVSGDLDTGITVQANSKEQQYKSWVIDTILNDNVLKRTVIPSGKVTAVEDISYVDGALVGYGVTVSAVPDESGNTHYEYIVKG